jgi:hypothetical protein
MTLATQEAVLVVVQLMATMMVKMDLKTMMDLSLEEFKADQIKVKVMGKSHKRHLQSLPKAGTLVLLLS